MHKTYKILIFDSEDYPLNSEVYRDKTRTKTVFSANSKDELLRL